MAAFLTANATQSARPWFEALARAGFVAKAILYFTIGLLAAAAALGKGGKTTDSHGALVALIQAPLGRVLLGLIAFALLGYAVWRVIDGIADPEHNGRSATGIMLRVASIGSAALHLALAGTAARLALWQTSDGGEQGPAWAARALRIPGGRYLLWSVAIGLLGYSAWQLYCAVNAKLDKQLELDRGRRWLIGISRCGIAARGLVLGMFGVAIGRAATHYAPREAGGKGKALGELLELGRLPFLAIALGLVAYGIYQLVEARFRRIG